MIEKDHNDLTGDIFRHNKNQKLYQVIAFCLIESTGDHAVIYRDVDSKILYVRPTSEFFDGRFQFFSKSQ